jgi:hypothetical protein
LQEESFAMPSGLASHLARKASSTDKHLWNMEVEVEFLMSDLDGIWRRGRRVATMTGLWKTWFCPTKWYAETVPVARKTAQGGFGPYEKECSLDETREVDPPACGPQNE